MVLLIPSPFLSRLLNHIGIDLKSQKKRGRDGIPSPFVRTQDRIRLEFSPKTRAKAPAVTASETAATPESHARSHLSQLLRCEEFAGL